MGNLTSLAMGLAAQEEEEEEVASVVSEVEGGAGVEEQQEVTQVVSEGEEGAGEEQQQEEQAGGDAKAEEDVEREEQDVPVLQCSICLDAVVGGGEERSTARLQCGHQFHLDCIGSAFNAKGMMQCPNCRRIETGYWRYAGGPRSPQDLSSDDWVLDEDLDFAPEVFVPLRFQWYPISRWSELPSLFGEAEPSSAAATYDAREQNFNAEPIDLPGPSTTPQGAYVAYLQPLPPPVSSSSSHTVDRTVDDHWNSLAGPSDDQPVQGVHPIDNPWAPSHSYSPPNNNHGAAERSGLPVGGIRIGGVDSGSQQRGSLPPFYGNGAERRGVPSVPLAPQLVRAPGNINPQSEQGSSSSFTRYQPLYGGVRPFGAGRIPPDWSLLPEGSSDSSFVETTTDEGGNRFYWERAHFLPHSLVNDEGVWASSSQQQPPRSAPEPAPAPRVLFGHWTSSASARPPPPPENDRSPDDTSFQ